MLSFWIIVFIISAAFVVYGSVGLILTLLRYNKLLTIAEHIATEYATKWFTLESLLEHKFKRYDCEYIVVRMLAVKVLASRNCDSKEPNDFQEVVLTASGNTFFLDQSKLKPFLEQSEFRYVGPPPPRRKRKSRKLNWDTLLPQGLRPAYS